MYKIRKDRLCLLIFIVLLLAFFIYFSLTLLIKKFITSPKKSDKVSPYKAFITDKSELNPEEVKEYFVKGMSVNDYKSALEKVDNYVEIKGKYEAISYNFEKNYHYDELVQIYEQLARSDIVKLEIIGQSVDGRNLYAIEIGNGDEVTIFEASIHAAETAGTLFITKYMVDLVNKYEKGDSDTIKLLQNNKIIVIPSANPDGYETAYFGTKALNNQKLYIAKNASEESLTYIKTNANGIDLNRNFPSQTAGLYYNFYDLHPTVSLEVTTDRVSYYPGKTLGSEPEVRAIMYLQNKWIKNIKSYVALHTAGRYIYNGKPYLSDEYNENVAICANIVGDITDYTVLSKNIEDAGQGNDGTSSEFMAESLSGFTFSSKTGRLSSDYYAQFYDEFKYPNACVIVIESLDTYSLDLDDIKNEYEQHHLDEAYTKIVER